MQKLRVKLKNSGLKWKKLRVRFQKTQGQNSKTQVSEFLLIWSNSVALHKKSLAFAGMQKGGEKSLACCSSNLNH